MGLMFGAQASAQQPAPEIQAIRFIGGGSIDQSLLLEAIATQPSRCRSPLFVLPCRFADYDWAERKHFLTDTAQVGTDAERIATVYEIWGFPDAQVSGAVIPERDDDVVVEFTIAEGEPILIERMEITGLDTLRHALHLPALLPLRANEPYALPRLEATRELLLTRLADAGHPYAAIAVTGNVDEATRRASLELRVERGPTVVLGAPTIEVTLPLRERDVLARMTYAPGALFRTSTLEDTQTELYDLPAVARAIVAAPGLERRDTVIHPRIVIEARKRLDVALEGAVSSSDCVEVNAIWRQRYLFGRPGELAVGLGSSNLLAAHTDGGFPCASAGTGDFAKPNYGAFAEYRLPSFLSGRSDLFVRGFMRRESAPGTYIATGYGGRVAVGRAFGSGLHGYLAYAPEFNEMSAADAYYCGGYGVCTREAIDGLEGSQTLAPFEATLLWASNERSANVRRPDPNAGTEWVLQDVPDWRYSVSGAVQAGGKWSGSDYVVQRALIEAGATRVIGRNLELAAHTRFAQIGSSTSALPPQLRLFSGGPETVRGLEQNLLGPKVLLANTNAADCATPICGVTDGVADPDRVLVRPLGGDRVVEVGVEGRLWLSDRFQVAAFADYGRLSAGRAQTLDGVPIGSPSESVITPGIGLRVITDIGPLRVDLAYDPTGTAELPVLVRTRDGSLEYAGTAHFNPFAHGDPNFIRRFGRRLQLQLAVGQAF